MKNTPQTILLDLGGVVFNSTGISNKTIDWKIINELNHKYFYDLNIGKDFFPNFMIDYNTLTQQNLSGQDFLKNIFDTLEFNESLINRLQKNFRIYIVSDNYRENIAYISQRYNFSNWATQQYYSFDFQLVKSDPLFFKQLLKEIKIEPQNLLFIDDSESKLASAKESGIKGILFQNNTQLFQDLKTFLPK